MGLSRIVRIELRLCGLATSDAALGSKAIGKNTLGVAPDGSRFVGLSQRRVAGATAL